MLAEESASLGSLKLGEGMANIYYGNDLMVWPAFSLPSPSCLKAVLTNSVP